MSDNDITPVGNATVCDADAGDSHYAAGTFFTTKMVAFPKVFNAHIDTEQFLQASKTVKELVDKFGKVFSAVSYDLNGNIFKLEKKFKENKEMYKHIEDMILDEKKVGDMVATDALLWLRRGLHFLLRFLQLIQQEDDFEKSLSPLMKVAYGEILEPFHGWMGSQLFNILCRFAPTRKGIYKVLAPPRLDKFDLLQSEINDYLVNLQSCIDHLIHFYETNGLEQTTRV